MPLEVNFVTYTSLSVLLASWALATSVHGPWSSSLSSEKAPPEGYEGMLVFSDATLSAVANSDLKIMILLNFCINVLVFVFEACSYVCLGGIRTTERQSLQETAINYSMFKLVFFCAVLEPDFFEFFLWTGWFMIVGFLKFLSVLCKERGELHIVNGEGTRGAEKKGLVMCVLGTLVLDGYLIWLALDLFSEAGTSSMLLLLFEPVVVFMRTVLFASKYTVFAMNVTAEEDDDNDPLKPGGEMHDGIMMGEDSEEADNCRSMYYLELVMNVVIGLLTIAHFMHIWILNGFSFTLIDGILFLNMRAVSISVKNRVVGYLNYRRIVATLKEWSVDEAEVAKIDDACAICLRKMTSSVNRLPCGHHFHFKCLCHWLERLEQNPTCPVCRAPVLKPKPRPTASDVGLPTGNRPVDDLEPPTSVDESAPPTFELFAGDDGAPGILVEEEVEMGLPDTVNNSPPFPRSRSNNWWPQFSPPPDWREHVVDEQEFVSRGENEGGDSDHESGFPYVDENILRDVPESPLAGAGALDNFAEPVPFSLAEPFLPTADERHQAFQNRKKNILAEGRRRYLERQRRIEAAAARGGMMNRASQVWRSITSSI
jgi:hypothetical protein